MIVVLTPWPSLSLHESHSSLSVILSDNENFSPHDYHSHSITAGEANFLGGVAGVYGVPNFDPQAAKKRFFEIYIGQVREETVCKSMKNACMNFIL